MQTAGWTRGANDWRRLLPLAAGTLLLGLGLFCAWQTWLIAIEQGAAERVEQAQQEAVRAVGEEIAATRTRASEALATVDPIVQDDPALLAAAVRRRLPQVLAVEVYSAGLDEVLHADYRTFGYAKAAQLLAALQAQQGAAAGDAPAGDSEAPVAVDAEAAAETETETASA